MRRSTQLAIAGSFSLLLVILPIAERPAIAQLREEFSLQQAQTGAIDIRVGPGLGTNLDFTRTGQYIYRAWLDDPSRILVETDTPIEAANAQIIHLRKIEHIDFDGLPATGTTLLSVATVTPSGERNLYQFRVSYSANPPYTTIALLPGRTQANVAAIPSSAAFDVDGQTFRLGIAQLLLEGTIQSQGPMHNRLKDFVALVEGGDRPDVAAQTVDLSMAVVEAVSSLGLQVAAEQSAASFADDEAEPLAEEWQQDEFFEEAPTEPSNTDLWRSIVDQMSELEIEEN
ncbi:MAG: hypothetical protein F6K00_33655 [Leptolyngbya sp. SIOISBB]|nr:hypothetical protein [Leptolyngbya sp. SIOISBB]